MFENINFGIGVDKKYNDFYVNKEISLKEQVDLLKEDLFQISYKNNHIIDVGWYPEFSAEGNFRIVVVKDYNWDAVIIEKKCKDLNTLEQFMEECVKIVQEDINK